MRSKKEYCEPGIRIVDIGTRKQQEVSLMAKSTYVLTIDYPFGEAGHFVIKTSKKMPYRDLLLEIKKCYLQQYKLANKKGIGYWHVIEDLFLEGLEINNIKKTIKLEMGS